MWQKRQAHLLAGELNSVLSSLSGSADLYDLVKSTLVVNRRGLNPGSAKDRPWPLLPLIVCQAICGRYGPAIPIAACLQLLMAAGDTFDDVEDADSPESLSARYGNAKAVNAATTLLILAEREVTKLKEKGVDNDNIIRIMEVINTYYTTACIGQHLDLSLTTDYLASEEAYLKVISMKSASQIECACHVGALLATDNEHLISQFCTFGHNLGMASQIINDVMGVTGGADVTKPKITLPVIYALTHTEGKIRKQLERTFSTNEELTLKPASTKDLLYNTGAVHYATIKAELYKQDALDALNSAEEMGANVERLQIFLG